MGLETVKLPRASPGLIMAAVALALASCGGQSAPAMPRETFAKAAARCSLKATTYTPERGWFLSSALIDFSKESNPKAAHACFDKALDEVDQDQAGMSYIWDTLE